MKVRKSIFSGDPGNWTTPDKAYFRGACSLYTGKVVSINVSEEAFIGSLKGKDDYLVLNAVVIHITCLNALDRSIGKLP